jgi:hypothetical protein
MKKWIAKLILLAVFVTSIGAGARVLAEDVIHNPKNLAHSLKAKVEIDPTSCGCLYHAIENFVIGIFN